jgi:hypothetical protein
LVVDFVDDILTIGQIKDWLAFVVARDRESRVATIVGLHALDMKREAYALAIATAFGVAS